MVSTSDREESQGAVSVRGAQRYLAFVQIACVLASLVCFVVWRVPVSLALGLIFLLQAIPYFFSRTKLDFAFPQSMRPFRLILRALFNPIWLAISFPIASVIAAAFLFRLALNSPATDSRFQVQGTGFVFLLLGFIWVFFSRAIAAKDSGNQRTMIREAELASFGVAGVLFVNPLFPSVSLSGSLLFISWILVQNLEVSGRMCVLCFLEPLNSRTINAALAPRLREFFFNGVSPRENLRQAIRKLTSGATRSHLLARIVHEAFLPVLFLGTIFLWFLTSIRIVNQDELAIKTTMGVIDRGVLGPGLHIIAPWPFGGLIRLPVKRVSTTRMSVHQDAQMDAYRLPAFLWNDEQSLFDFSLVVGDATELLSVTAQINYKIREDASALRHFAFEWEGIPEVLSAVAQAALMERTRSTKLDQVLSEDRANFAQQVEENLKKKVDDLQLGIEVQGVDILSIHPHLSATPSYLEVINARFHADRALVFARGEKATKQEVALAERASLKAAATAAAHKRISIAMQDTARFVGLAKGSEDDFRLQRFRLAIEIQEEALSQQKLIVVDKSLPTRAAEFWLDLRSIESSAGTSSPPRGEETSSKNKGAANAETQR
jgi:regulator of protease activity HflC (stomatin/prohibitin superfamily)